MKLTKLARSKSFEMVNGYGLKQWYKYGLEAEISPNENPIELYKELDAMIEQAHKDSYDTGIVPEKQVDKPKENPVDNMITAITTSTTIEVLKTFEKLAKSKPEFEQAYNETMIKLTNKN